MSVLRIINTFNANSKIGKILIRLNNYNNYWNSEIFRMITDRYTNVYDIAIVDYTWYLDNEMHNCIKKYVK